ncbi:MAG: hypothetical protein CMP03_05375 [Woeseiaceae bacterium]|nr:hypothetical protein [Woeseiaceae bacterium]|tara:strand:- start:170 stop:766 length:597 start_codon:yes stop_codon:yes gene_type:complete
MIDKLKISKGILSKINSQITTRTSAKKISQELEGKILSIQIKNTSHFFNVIMISNELNLHTNKENFDVQISGSLISFTNLLRDNSSDALRDGSIGINGDVAVAQKFQKLFEMIKPDIEEELSHIVGDVMANNIVKFSKKTGDWMLNTRDILQENIKEYLQEEIKLMPSKYEFNFFSKEVSKIRDDIERLEKKINEFQR